ncbi:MAG: hypothetical protein V1810_04220 [Candidatus Beckwithbacteria bacterium]
MARSCEQCPLPKKCEKVPGNLKTCLKRVNDAIEPSVTLAGLLRWLKPDKKGLPKKIKSDTLSLSTQLAKGTLDLGKVLEIMPLYGNTEEVAAYQVTYKGKRGESGNVELFLP